MKRIDATYRILPRTAVVILSVLAVACGGSGDGRDPLLGAGDVNILVAPTVTAVSPLPNTAGVPRNTGVVMAAFSKTMDAASLNVSNFTLACPATAPLTNGVVSYLAASRTAVLTLPAGSGLPADTVCTATVSAAAKDSAGIPMTSSFAWQFSTGAALDTTAPAITGTSNANGSGNVAVNTKVGVSFSEAMNPSSIAASSFSLMQGTTAVVGSISYSGISATFTPASPLAFNTLYTATVTSSATDLAGNPLASDYVWHWTTGAAPDTKAPTVTGTINANGANNVSINTHLGVTFSEAMSPLTVNNLNFSLKESVSGKAVAGVINYAGVTAAFVPLANLTPGTLYTVTVKGGSGGVEDLAGNAMVSDFVIQWTTATTAALDTTPPIVTATLNANGATNVTINTKVGVTFSEAIDPLTVSNSSIMLRQGTSQVLGTTTYSGVTGVFAPASPLAYNTTYTATVTTAIKDLAGNPMASNYVWSWTTGAATDTTAPSVLGTIHANGAIDVAINTQVGATFSEAMDPLTITNANFELTESVKGVVVAGVVRYSGLNATFVPVIVLASGTRYTVTIKGGSGGVEDLAGNPMTHDYVISWTTAAQSAAIDTTAPTVLLVRPAHLATGVATSSSVAVTFNEAMDPLTMNNVNFRVAGVAGTVIFDALGKIATFTPSTALANNTSYTATVSHAVTDLAGNALASDKAWTFTTAAAEVMLPVINLSTAAPYGTFGGTAGMTNTGTLTQVNGNIGSIATGTSMITGFHDTLGDIYTETPANIGTVNGIIYTCTNSVTGPNLAAANAVSCAKATQARLDAQAAYLALAALPPGANPGANLANLTLAPGTYTAPAGSFLIEGGNLTLDAQGNANAVWVFQMATTLTVGGPGAAFPQSIILAGGAQAKNIFWQVGSFATINAAGGGSMAGNILAQMGAAFSTVGNTNIVTLNGRVLSLGASVTLVNTVINVPAN
jgi:hypothetical protein